MSKYRWTSTRRARRVVSLASLFLGDTFAVVPLTRPRSWCPNRMSDIGMSDFVPCTRARTSRTRMRMVANTPDALVEQSWTQALLDQILDESLRYSARRPLIMEFDPSSKAIWRHWKGTIFAETWMSAAKHVLWAITVYFVFCKYPKVKLFLKDFDELWGQTLSVTTFTLSFFVNQAYSLWRTCLTISRSLQGRLNDLMMGLATHAERVDPDSPDGSSQFTVGSRQMLQVVARYVRLFHIFCYGSFTRSYRPLLTPRGMRRMEERGLMTPKERKVLVQAQVAATQRFNIVLMWIFRSVLEGRKANLVSGGSGFEQQTFGKIQEIRAQANSMESVLRGRMPFAYAHVVQVLVDAVLWMYPVGAYSKGISLQIGVLGSFLLTICYQGLFDLSKRFLDPYHNENFWSGDDALVVDTLIAESNRGSVRWVYGLDEMPIPHMSFRDADFDAYILPDEGYSKEKAAEMLEQEKKKEAEESLLVTVNMTQEEYHQKAVEILEAAEEEYEETQKILNAPPGSDFVPGLDEYGDSSTTDTSNSTKATATALVKEVLETEVDELERFEKFVDAAEEEYRGSK